MTKKLIDVLIHKKKNHLSKYIHKKFPLEGSFMALPLDLPVELLTTASSKPFSFKGVLLTLAAWVPIESLSVITIPLGLTVHKLRKSVSKKKNRYSPKASTRQIEPEHIFSTAAYLSKSFANAANHKHLRVSQCNLSQEYEQKSNTHRNEIHQNHKPRLRAESYHSNEMPTPRLMVKS